MRSGGMAWGFAAVGGCENAAVVCRCKRRRAYILRFVRGHPLILNGAFQLLETYANN